MSKFILAFLSGIFFTFILDFFLFLGIKLNYIDYYEIDVYYNILFADHQSIIAYALSTLILGYITIYIDNNKLSAIVLGVLFFIVSLTLIPPIGKSVGTMLLMQKNVTLKDHRYTYKGDIYYEGRENITFYDYDLDKIITLEKKDLKQ